MLLVNQMVTWVLPSSLSNNPSISVRRPLFPLYLFLFSIFLSWSVYSFLLSSFADSESAFPCAPACVPRFVWRHMILWCFKQRPTDKFYWQTAHTYSYRYPIVAVLSISLCMYLFVSLYGGCLIMGRFSFTFISCGPGRIAERLWLVHCRAHWACASSDMHEAVREGICTGSRTGIRSWSRTSTSGAKKSNLYIYTYRRMVVNADETTGNIVALSRRCKTGSNPKQKKVSQNCLQRNDHPWEDQAVNNSNNNNNDYKWLNNRL